MTISEINTNHNIFTDVKAMFISTNANIENYADVHSDFILNKNWANIHISFMQMR